MIRSTSAVGFKTLAVATSYPVEKLNDANYVVKSLHPDVVKAAVPGLKL